MIHSFEKKHQQNTVVALTWSSILSLLSDDLRCCHAETLTVSRTLSNFTDCSLLKVSNFADCCLSKVKTIKQGQLTIKVF